MQMALPPQSPKTPQTPHSIGSGKSHDSQNSQVSDCSVAKKPTTAKRLSKGVTQVFGPPAVPHLVCGESGKLEQEKDANGKPKQVLTALHRGCLIHPHCVYMQKWDVVIGLCLIYTVLVTPFEIALVDSSVQPFGMFVIGTMIDLVFAKDTVMQFFTMYEERSTKGNVWVRNQRKIVRRYLKGWFVIDFVSIFPFSRVFPLIFGGNFAALRNMRVIRVVRLAKLVRLVRGSRVLKRFEMNMSISYSQLAILKLFCLMMMVTHWAACFWCLAGSVHQDTYKPVQEGWLAVVRGNKNHPAEGDIAGIYFAALAYSYASLTGVGYGDIAPTNQIEYIIGCFIQVYLGVSWAYIVGNFCGIVAGIRSQDSLFEMTLDSLNHMVTEMGIPHSIAKQMRGYFHDLRPADRMKVQQKLVNRLSPLLQSEVTQIIHHHWIAKLWYFSNCSKAFISQLCVHIPIKVFLKQEMILAPQSVVALTEGIAIYKMTFFRCGAVWGIETLLTSMLNDPKMHRSAFLEHASTRMDLEDGTAAVAVTNVEVLLLSRKFMQEMLKEWPADRQIIRKLMIRSLMRSRIVEWSRRVREEHSKDQTRCKKVVKREVLLEFNHRDQNKKWENTDAAVKGLEEQVKTLKSDLESLPSLMEQFLERRRAKHGKNAQDPARNLSPKGQETVPNAHVAESDEGRKMGAHELVTLDPSTDAHPEQDQVSNPSIDCLSDKQIVATSSPSGLRRSDSATASGLQSTAASDAPSQSEGNKSDNIKKRKSLSKKAAERNTSNSIVSGLQPKALAASLAQLFSLQQDGSKDMEWQMKPVKEAAKKLVDEKVKPCAASFFFHQADVDKNGMLDRAQLARALQTLPGFGDEYIPLFEVKVAELYSEGDGQLDLDEWIDLCEEIPELLNAVTKKLESQGWRRLLGCEESVAMPGEVSDPQKQEAGDDNNRDEANTDEVLS
jgi:hypothetical protein